MGSGRSTSPLTTPVDTLIGELEKLRIRSPEKQPTRRQVAHSSLDTDSSFEPLEVIEETREPDEANHPSPPSLHSQVLRAVRLDNTGLAQDSLVRSIVADHEAGRYDWILTLPATAHEAASTNDRKIQDQSVRYGCNLLMERKGLAEGLLCEGHFVTVFTLLATVLSGEETLMSLEGTLRTRPKNDEVAMTDPVVRVTSPPAAGQAEGRVVDIIIPGSSSSGTGRDTSEKASPRSSHERGDDRGSMFDASSSSSRSTSTSSNPAARIEDSVETLDRLEEEIEQLDTMTRFEYLMSVDKKHETPSRSSEATVQHDRTALKRASLPIERKTGKSASVRVKSTTSRPALRKSASMSLSGKVEKEMSNSSTVQAKGAGQDVPSKTPVAGSSPKVQSPKHAAKSNKAPTKPSFELPGEAVARRLKEQREARRSLQAAQEQPAPSGPQRVKSIKAPTRPAFELPGEAISRRKREQREKEMREKEEVERERRQFRAAPVPSSSKTTAYPRDTAASRGRRAKAFSEENYDSARGRRGQASFEETTGPSSRGAISATPVVTKRASMPSLTRPTLAKSGTTASGGGNAPSSQTQRRAVAERHSESLYGSGTSTAGAGLGANKRNSVSAEEVLRQRLRGKEIYERDNCYVEERERERRQRELLAQRARSEAAERSRQAGREWLERQKRRSAAVVA